MNRLASILPAAQVLVSVDATSKKRAFEEAGLLFENLHGLSRALITDSLFARERLGSTGLGHGVAIPHGRIKGLKAPMAALFQLASPIGFDAPGRKAGRPAHLPAGARGRHPEAPGDPVGDRRAAVRRAAAREDQGHHRRGRTAQADRHLAIRPARLVCGPHAWCFAPALPPRGPSRLGAARRRSKYVAPTLGASHLRCPRGGPRALGRPGGAQVICHGR